MPQNCLNMHVDAASRAPLWLYNSRNLSRSTQIPAISIVGFTERISPNSLDRSLTIQKLSLYLLKRSVILKEQTRY